MRRSTRVDVRRDLRLAHPADQHYRQERGRHGRDAGRWISSPSTPCGRLCEQAQQRRGRRQDPADQHTGGRAARREPRHQMPSTSSGQKVEAATAKTSGTISRGRAAAPSAPSRSAAPPTTTAASRKSFHRPRRTSVYSTRPGSRPARTTSTGTPPRARPRRARRAATPSSPRRARPRAPAAPRRRCRRWRAVRRVEPGEHPEQHGHDVEPADHGQHRDGRAPGRPAVRVRVEADEHVRQAHRAQRAGDEHRVDGKHLVLRVAGPRFEPRPVRGRRTRHRRHRRAGREPQLGAGATSCRPGAHVTDPLVRTPSTVPSTTSVTGSGVCRTTSVRTSTVVATRKSGAESRSRLRLSDRNRPSTNTAGRPARSA